MNNNTNFLQQNIDYTPPKIEIYEFATERGFAQSNGSFPDYGDGGNLN